MMNLQFPRKKKEWDFNLFLSFLRLFLPFLPPSKPAEEPSTNSSGLNLQFGTLDTTTTTLIVLGTSISEIFLASQSSKTSSMSSTRAPADMTSWNSLMAMVTSKTSVAKHTARTIQAPLHLARPLRLALLRITLPPLPRRIVVEREEAAQTRKKAESGLLVSLTFPTTASQTAWPSLEAQQQSDS